MLPKTGTHTHVQHALASTSARENTCTHRHACTRTRTHTHIHTHTRARTRAHPHMHCSTNNTCNVKPLPLLRPLLVRGKAIIGCQLNYDAQSPSSLCRLPSAETSARPPHAWQLSPCGHSMSTRHLPNPPETSPSAVCGPARVVACPTRACGPGPTAKRPRRRRRRSRPPMALR
jgi:hypothetical protein